MTTTTPTSDGAALLAAIVAQPGEDTPRLAYADWLAENPEQVPCFVCHGAGTLRSGYVKCDARGIHDTRREETCLNCAGTGTVLDTAAQDRAEFIRSQVELQNCPTTHGADTDYGIRWAKLRVKESALLTAHPEWKPVCPNPECVRGSVPGPDFAQYGDTVPCEVCQGTGRCPCKFRRGFVASVRAPTLASVMRHFPELDDEGDTWQRTEWAARLVREHPVERVYCVDRMPVGPLDFRGEQVWVWNDWEGVQQQNGIPIPILLLLKGGEIYARSLSGEPRSVMYRSQDAAQDALATAIAEWLRRKIVSK